MPRTQKVERLLEEYVKIRDENPNLTIKEIADKYGVSVGTIYYHLPESAARTGRTRDELLNTPRKKNCSKKAESKNLDSKESRRKNEALEETEGSNTYVSDLLDEAKALEKVCLETLETLETCNKED